MLFLNLIGIAFLFFLFVIVPPVVTQFVRFISYLLDLALWHWVRKPLLNARLRLETEQHKAAFAANRAQVWNRHYTPPTAGKGAPASAKARPVAAPATPSPALAPALARVSTSWTDEQDRFFDAFGAKGPRRGKIH